MKKRDALWKGVDALLDFSSLGFRLVTNSLELLKLIMYNTFLKM